MRAVNQALGRAAWLRSVQGAAAPTDEDAQAFVAERLAAPDLPPEQRQRLEHRQAQLGRFATLPPQQQDQLLHRRFERMDANRDGVVDAGELQAFGQAQRERAQAKRDAGGAGGNNDDFWPSPN